MVKGGLVYYWIKDIVHMHCYHGGCELRELKLVYTF